MARNSSGLHTVIKSQIVSKKSIFRKMTKIVNLIFRVQKLRIQSFQFLIIPFLIKITIIGGKIQIIQVIFPF